MASVIELLPKGLPVYAYGTGGMVLLYPGNIIHKWLKKHRSGSTYGWQEVHHIDTNILSQDGEIIYPVDNYEHLVESKKKLLDAMEVVREPFEVNCLYYVRDLLKYINIPDFPTVKTINNTIKALKEKENGQEEEPTEEETE